MLNSHITVPVSLLCDTQLSPAAKLVAILLKAGAVNRSVQVRRETGAQATPVTPGAELLKTCGLDRNTIRRALSELASTTSAGAGKEAGMAPAGHVIVPLDLLLDVRPGIRAKLMYGILQLTPGFGRSQGQFTFAKLASLAGVSLNTVKQALRDLRETNWLHTSPSKQRSPIHFTLHHPPAEKRDQALTQLNLRLEESSFKGEAIMREYLSVMVDSDTYEDNASPGFLVNPITGEEMQFDRYYPPDVAFEFNGTQHYAPTSQYPSEVKVRMQQARDYIKMGICMTRGIRLIVIHARDLSLEGLRHKIDGLLPLRNLESDGQVVAYLEGVSRGYRRKARKEENRRRGGSSHP